jgi:hypothetical protein
MRGCGIDSHLGRRNWAEGEHLTELQALWQPNSAVCVSYQPSAICSGKYTAMPATMVDKTLRRQK